LTDFSAISLGLRLSFFILVAVSMAQLSSKEQADRLRIQTLNLELDQRRLELQREKDKLENILVGIGAGLVLVNREMRIEWMNKVAESWFGSEESKKGRFCASALWGDDRPCANCPTKKAFLTGEVVLADIERQVDSEQRRCYRLTSTPIRHGDGQIVNVLELIQDITAEKALQAQLVHSGKLVAMGELASGIAHEINNPLSSIGVCVEELAEIVQEDNRDGPDNGGVEECIASIKNDIRRCKRITTGFLNLSRRKEAQFEPTDINQLLMNTALLTRYKARQCHTEINFYLSSNLSLIHAEPDELTQVFLNILINAMDFTTAGQSIDVYSDMADEETIIIRIVDHGRGIPQKNLGRIFNPFFTTKPPGLGTGLGLSISRRIIEQHCGKIKVESQLDLGTIVRVLLPVDPRHKAACTESPEKIPLSSEQ
jgi:signal transduction histidine kinase